MRALTQTGLWRWLKGTGLERFELLRASQEWILRGTIIALTELGPAEARYEIVCGDSWRTSRADISIRDRTEERTLKVAVESGQWYTNGNAIDAIAGCTDIDLEWSPSTNTLPIRRLNLAIGGKSGPVNAAWVRFPNLTFEPLPQEYERISERGYRYTSHGGSFVAKIAVDQDGLVLDYEGIWQRVEAKYNK